jgi:hypothetical protein
MRKHVHNLTRGLLVLSFALPMLGVASCAPTSDEIRELALSSTEQFLLNLLSSALSNGFNALTN